MANKNTIKVDQPTAVLYPSEEKETRMAIRRVDWNRIKRLVDNIRPEPKFLRMTYSLFIGAAITAGATIIPIRYVSQIPPWFLLIYIFFAGFAFALGIILLLVDIFNTTSKSTDLKSLREDMQEIEDTFKRETGEEGIDSSQSVLEIIEATYGTNKNKLDVTEKLRKHVLDNTLTIQASNSFFGSDPDKGIKKKLRVKYNFAGKPHEKTVIETQSIHLP